MVASTGDTEKKMLPGLQLETPAGCTVWVGRREEGDILIKFVNPENTEPETTIRLSHDGAMTLLAVLQDTFFPGSLA